MDCRLPQPFHGKYDQDVILGVTLALASLRAAPKLQLSMKQVSQELSVSKLPFLVPFHDISVVDLMNQEITSSRASEL